MQESKNTIERRKKNRIRQFHHHAFRTSDMEATRKFWEDILECPLIGTFVETTDPVTEEPSNYIHTFFELGDGTALAFFQFQEGLYKESAIKGPQDPFDHHIALEVEKKEDIFAFKERLEAAGYDHMLIDHGYCYSIYAHDPNGMQIELTTKVPETVEIMEKHAKTAHEDLKKWLEGVTEANNKYRRMRDKA
ncbi:MAG TPA: glyoxalase/bleomycin resistance/extradiol dioxygenase family protein [Myxococcales bacterium]|nr:glyoxalase/bleomycin resistance/extradiol dioxygenase family protein [Deltaproteobacteria bacterium]HAA57139.1 glyoxalase/bleomycin resistance/extradiol dioxygenase family protein [Myxococcales bacterium]|tara:strand:- start:17390 stop:17965 length:576 start_codon:yes stop_codon:yes gene_type:complete